MISIWFLGGVQLFSIGIVGQYVGKAYFEAKQRPRYDIIENLNNGKIGMYIDELIPNLKIIKNA